MKTITTRYWTKFIFLLALSFVAQKPVKAQVDNPLIAVNFLDSIVADAANPFVRNNLNVTNIFNRPLTFTINIKTPEGFSLISQNGVSLELDPGESQIVPVTINKLKSASATIQQVAINFEFLSPRTEVQYSFAISAKELLALRVFQIQKEFQLTPEQRSVDIALKIKNIGNAPYEFFVQYFNKTLALDKRFTTTLNPFTDTIVRLKQVIPPAVLKNMVKETISVRVGTDTNALTYSFHLRRIKNANSDHASPFASFPMSLEMGAFMDNVSLSYFWGASGAIDFNENNLLSFHYRSKQYGMEGVQADVFNVFYRHKKWDITIGQMSAFSHFMANGIGAQLAYHKNQEEGVKLAVVTNNLSFNQKGLTGQTVGLNTKFKVGGMLWNALAMGYIDPSNTNQSYIYQNELGVINKKNINLALTLGAGLDQLNYEVPNMSSRLWGYNFGYDFKFERPKWQLLSNLLWYSNDFPGIYKGWRSANEELTYFLGQRISVSAFYNTNFTRQNFFIDSIYFDNQFLYNQTNFGLRLNYGSSKFNISIGGGNALSTGSQLSNTVPIYRMGTLSTTWTPSKNFRLSLNSTINFNESFGADKEMVIFYSNFLSFSSPYGGVNLIYNQMPQLTGNLDGTFVNSYRKNIGIAPYIRLNLFRNKLTGRIQYNHYRVFTPESIRENQYLVGGLNYNNSRLGITFQANVNYGIKTTSAHNPIRFVSLSLRKNFNVPIVFKRKYHNLNLYCYEDKNGNGIKDAIDTVVQNVAIDMNLSRLVSNQYGHARYKNMDTGTYVLDFRNMKNEKGLIPSRGYIQKLAFYGPTEMYIPFTQGKVVKGKVSITLDSLSANKFEVDQLKITATDSAGNKFFTYTDQNGNYQINLPASNYIISLNPEAFNDVFKPDQIAFSADLLRNNELSINFHIRQKARGIRIIKAKLD